MTPAAVAAVQKEYARMMIMPPHRRLMMKLAHHYSTTKHSLVGTPELRLQTQEELHLRPSVATSAAHQYLNHVVRCLMRTLSLDDRDWPADSTTLLFQVTWREIPEGQSQQPLQWTCDRRPRYHRRMNSNLSTGCATCPNVA